MDLKRALSGLSVSFLLAASASPQDSVYPREKTYRFKLTLEGLLRQEWTRDIFVASGPFTRQDRQRLRALPGLEIGLGKLVLGVAGDFNYSSDRNTEPPPGANRLALVRDNYKSRDARVDLAFASLKPVSWLQVQAGRFAMPVGLTEMTWDKDLRPQGAALTLEARDLGRVARLGLTGLWARGSHVFDDAQTTLVLASGLAQLSLGEGASLELTGSYLGFSRIGTMEPPIRRQNTRVAGQLVNEYRVIDGVARLRLGGGVPVQVVGDICGNTAVGDGGFGLWLAAVLGSLQSARFRADYTFASVDKDATLAAYPTDDFFWETGWSGHRLELGARLVDHVTAHALGQLERFKDSPRPEERQHWNKRARLELRIKL